MGNYLQHMEEISNDKSFQRRVKYLQYNYSNKISFLDSNSKVLEIGPGRGELLALLNEKGITNIDIIDNDISVLQYCQKSFKINGTYLSKSLDISKVLKNKYNLIVLTQVFEHIPKSAYLNWIRSLYSALQVGGNLIITVPNGANPLIGAERYGDLQHENIFTVLSFQELLTFSNLKNYKYLIQGFKIPPSDMLNIVRILLQKILHSIFIILMIINGGVYQKLLTPNITLIITKTK